MPLCAGARLGPYEIVAPLGAGGMGEVYQARDRRLDRDVAIKILPEALAADPDRTARFEREAKMVASLNEPHIAQIYGFEESNGVHALVMELVEGPTLADRIAQGPIPVNEALPIAKQIAEALEAAHEQGIIHRDLKPANIKLRPDGAVKVLDFGLAKLTAGDAGVSGNMRALSNSPTLSLQMTAAGLILGTAAYMSPEQAAGKPVDRRADIWAFGVVLWEMLTGKRLFDSETVPHTLADVLRGNIDFSALPDETPPAVRGLVRRCLDRDVRRRLRDIGEARVQIEDCLANPQRASGGAAAPSFWSPLGLPASVVAALALMALVAVSIVHFREAAPVTAPTVFQVLPPGKATFADYPAVSPDGRRLAFVANVDGKTLLWVRALDSLAAQSIPGTDYAALPFWSSDSRFLAFFAGGRLKKVDLLGGPPLTICSTSDQARGGTWGRDGTILFAGSSGPISRVPDRGGAPVPVTTVSDTEFSHAWPQFLPDGRHFLYWIQARDADRQKSGVVLGSLDDQPDLMQRRHVLAGASMAVYSLGYLFFEREGVLLAQPFDAVRFEAHGDPVPVDQQVRAFVGRYGWASFSISSGGTLAYVPGSGAKTQLTWFDRAGAEIGRIGQPEDQIAPQLSPDQMRVAVARRDTHGELDIWLADLSRDASTRLTFFRPGQNSVPVWSPDSARIAFNSNREGGWNLYQKAASGNAVEELLLKSRDAKLPTDWSVDGRFVLYQAPGPTTTKWNLWVLPLAGDRKPVPVVHNDFNDLHGQFSPDGEWIAYDSDQSTRLEVYVQRFPTSGEVTEVSTHGGSHPRWRRDGKELFYLGPDRRMMAVDVKGTATRFEVGQPRELFQTRVADVPFPASSYAVTADGQRFLIDTTLDEAVAPPITVVLNWAPKK